MSKSSENGQRWPTGAATNPVGNKLPNPGKSNVNAKVWNTYNLPGR